MTEQIVVDGKIVDVADDLVPDEDQSLLEQENEDLEAAPEAPKKEDFESEEEFESAVKQHEADNPQEPWLANDDLDDVPVKTHIRVKQKLKTTISEQNEELERAKTEIATLRAQNVKPAILKRPKEEDFDDDESYQAAKDKYDDAVTQQRYDRIEAEKRQKEAQQQQHTKVNAAVEEHYKRVDNLLKDSGVKEEIYDKADENLREAVDNILPSKDDFVFKHIISLLGKGSEKVAFFVGNNKTALNEFKSLLIDDKTGMKAVMYLGQQKERLTNPKKRTTRAPKPPIQLKSDEVTGTNGKALKKKYDKAHKAGKGQLAWNAKKAAKAAGVDVSTW